MKIIFSFILCLITLVSINAQSKIVPIVEIHSNALLGGVENGRWLDAKTTAGKLPNETLYKMYSLDSSGEIRFKKPTDEGIPCEGYYTVESELADKFGVAVGGDASWNAMPRASKAIDLNDATYKKAVADVLRSKGLPNSTVTIKKAFRIDLEGDGQEEVLIEARSYPGNIQPSAKRGDYSFVLLRKIVGGKVQNIVVSGDFITKNIKFGAPSKYELSAVADLNGDGKMEVVIYAAYYEGSWVETYETKGNRLIRQKTFDVNCGV